MADETTDEVDQPGEGESTTDTKPDELGDAGKKALAAERSARRQAEKAAKAAEVELEKLRTDAMSEQEKAIAAARAEARAEALEAANARLVRAEVRAAAAGRLANPDLAPRLLNLDEFEVGDDGEVDTAAITKALDALVEAEPYLAVSAKRPAGTADGGARNPSAATSTTDMNALLRAAAQGRT